MDINDLRGISTVLVMIAFIGVCAWAYSSKSKAKFDEAANLPFADDQEEIKQEKGEERHT